MKKFAVVALIGLLMAVGLVLAGCAAGPGCPGNGNCTVTIKQDAYGLSVDNNFPISSCGRSGSYDYTSGYYGGGCKVVNNINGPYGYTRKYGTQSCNCD